MNGVEKIFESKRLVGIVIRSKARVANTKFFTDPGNPIQLGMHEVRTKKESALHSHKSKKPLKISEIHEVLFVQKGKIEVILESKSGKRIVKKTLKKNDTILIMDIAHGVTFTKGAKVIEVRQGPYLKENA